MARRASYHRDKRRQVYRTDVGGRTVYFRGIAREDHVAIAQAFTEHLTAIESGRRPKEPDFYDLVAAFLKADRGPKERRTRETHKERLSKFASYPEPDHPDEIGMRPARSLRAADLRGAIAAWQKAGLSSHYIAGLCRSVKAASAWAATEAGGMILLADPFREVKVPKTDRSPARYAERSELAAFLRFAWRRAGALPDGVRPRFARKLVLLIRLAAHVGARPGTLVSAWWSDFDPEAGTLTLPPDRHKTGKKTGRPLVLYLPPTMVRALARERDRKGRHPKAIFTHERGKWGEKLGHSLTGGVPWGRFIDLPDGRPTFNPETKPLCHSIRKLRLWAIEEGERLKAAGQPTRGLDQIQHAGPNRFVHFRLRHTKASDDVRAGGKSITVATLLGTSVRMLETSYAHLKDDHLARSATELARAKRAHLTAPAPAPTPAPDRTGVGSACWRRARAAGRQPAPAGSASVPRFGS